MLFRSVGSSLGGDESGSALESSSHLGGGHLGGAECDNLVSWGEEGVGGLSIIWDLAHLTEHVDEFSICG